MARPGNFVKTVEIKFFLENLISFYHHAAGF